MSNVIPIVTDTGIVELLEAALRRAKEGRVLCLAIAEYGPADGSPKREVRVSYQEPNGDPLAILAVAGGLAKLQAHALEDVQTS
jgi:hypothetical protein